MPATERTPMETLPKPTTTNLPHHLIARHGYGHEDVYTGPLIPLFDEHDRIHAKLTVDHQHAEETA